MILWGVQRVFLQELDPVTMSPPASGGALYTLTCVESVSLDPQIDEGDVDTLRCPSDGRVLATRETNDAFTGYDITLTDNEWNMGVFALVNGFDQIPDSPADPTTVVTPMLADGLNFRPFRMIIFHAGYEGDEIVRYLVTVLNKCTGQVSTFGTAQEWGQLEYTIRAREATKAGLPVASWGYYEGSVAPDDLDGITITAGVIQPGAPDPDPEGFAARTIVAPDGTKATTAKVTVNKASK